MQTSHEKEANKQPQVERRKDDRLPLSFQIEVSGFDRDGHLFREQTVTTDISESGCRFDLMREIHKTNVLAIQLIRQDGLPYENRHLLFEVAWVQANGGGWTIGAEKLQAANIWHVAFPAKKPPTTSQ